MPIETRLTRRRLLSGAGLLLATWLTPGAPVTGQEGILAPRLRRAISNPPSGMLSAEAHAVSSPGQSRYAIDVLVTGLGGAPRLLAMADDQLHAALVELSRRDRCDGVLDVTADGWLITRTEALLCRLLG